MPQQVNIFVFFFGRENHEFIIGARYIGAWAKKKDYGYDGWEGSAKTVFKLPCDFELSPFLAYTQEYYRGPATALESSKREDRWWRAGSMVTYRFNEAWPAEVMYQYMSNDSRSGLYGYTQNLVSAGVAWNF